MYFLLFLLFPSIVQSFEIFNNNSVEKFENFTISCVKDYLKKYFNIGRSVQGSLTAVNFNTNLNNSIIQERILKILHNENYQWSMIISANIEDIESNLTFETDDKAKNYLIFIDDLDDIETLVDELQSTTFWNPLAQILIYFINDVNSSSPSSSVSEFEENIKNIGLNFLKNDILNVYVLIHNLLNNVIKIFTFFPYEKNCCGHDINYIHEIFNCEYNNKKLIIEEKIEYSYKKKIPNNLHNCPLRVSARAWEPYVIYNLDTEILQGIDINIIEIITNHLKMKVIMTLENRSIYHILQDIIER